MKNVIINIQQEHIQKRFIAFAVITFIMIASHSCDFYSDMRKSQRAYEALRQVTGQKDGINITFINSEWNDGVDAIGVVEKYIKPGVLYIDYYYRDTDSFSWHHFYRFRKLMSRRVE